MQGTPILFLDTTGAQYKLKIEHIDEITQERELNGESIYHIIHVSMITELLLRELCVYDPDFYLSEEEICAITTASAMHDIGKMKIPKSILDFPGTLSSLEYDIVKKHSVFGEQIIREAIPEEVPPLTVEYAAQIARCHHERIDSTGYPDGLGGYEIPLCAQVVSLADSFDALTSSRSYKAAFSQDVALQMISSGMCGVFDTRLTECLMRVINHRTLVTFRETLQKRRSVVSEPPELSLRRVLLIGKTEYLTEAFISSTFPESDVVIAGKTDIKTTNRIKHFRTHKPSVDAILETFEFDLIVYFSSALRFQSTENNDSEELRELLKAAAELQKHTKILYLSPLDSSFAERTDKAILTSGGERLCEFYAKKHRLDIKTVLIPYLYSATCKDDFLYGVFEAMHQGKTVELPATANSGMHFLSLSDLSALILRIVDHWKSGSGVLRVGDEFRLTFSDLEEKLTQLKKDTVVDYTETESFGTIKTTNIALRSEYGWFAKISILEDLPDQYAWYLDSKNNKPASLLASIKKFFSKYTVALRILELFLLFFLSEYFIRITDSAVIFSIVDFRIIFIVIMATLYGLPYGIASATLTSVSYVMAKILSGADALTLFYEPTNWLPFVFYYLVGGLCGYVCLRKEDQLRSLKEQGHLLENKLAFTTEIYDDAMKEKKELKRQIIGSKDSFGKIFDITRKLNTVAAQQLYLRAIETFEEVLENKSIAIYSVNPHAAFGRLEVASRDLLDVAARSVSLDAYAPVISRLTDGEIFKNTDLNGEFPAYAAGVYREDSLVLVIFLWHAERDQRSLYYVNLFKIMRDLVQMSLLRAYDYTAAMLEKRFLPGTHILSSEHFEECLGHYAALADKKVSTYIMLEFAIKDYSFREIEEMFKGKIRANDILGTTKDGRLCLILPQATENDLDFILPRFQNMDVGVEVVKK